MKGKVNYNAIDTWLEPYIGYEFTITKITKKKVYFLIDYGLPQLEKVSADIESFKIIEK